MSPAGDTMALVDRESMPSIAYISEPILRIAGMRITPSFNSRQVLSFATGLSLKDMKTNVLRKVALPDGFKFAGGMGGVAWSPDGQRVALLRYVEGGVELWAVDVKTATAKALTPPVVNAVIGGIDWAPDSRRIVISLVPDGRGPAPVAPRVPIGPEIQVSGGKEAKVATYQDLLKNAFDEVLFDYYATSQRPSRRHRRVRGREVRLRHDRRVPSMAYCHRQDQRPYSTPARSSPMGVGTWTAASSRSSPTCRRRRASPSTASPKGRATSIG
jgi:dipeptidyl aminopeptidase/acylaminoacyl peptidase